MKKIRPAAMLMTSVGMSASFFSSAIADDQDAFRKVLLDPVEHEHVLSAAGRSTVFLQNPCPSAQFSLEKAYVVIQQPAADATDALVSGSWKHRIDEEGCGSKRILNVLVLVTGPKSLSFVPLLPGTTHAGPILQKDAVRYAVQVVAATPAAREPAPCQTGYIADTEFVSQGTTVLPGAKGSNWEEQWTLVSCTRKVRVPMHFIPDATGTTISAGPNTAVEVIPLALTP